jgi:hypothetical protein
MEFTRTLELEQTIVRGRIMTPPDAHVLNPRSWRDDTIQSLIPGQERPIAQNRTNLVSSRLWWRRPVKDLVHQALVVLLLLIARPSGD